MVHLLDIIREKHLSMSRLLALLEGQVELFENESAPDYELMREVIEYFLTFPDLFHHPKENLTLAKLRQRCPEIARKVGDLGGEHASCTISPMRFPMCCSKRRCRATALWRWRGRLSRGKDSTWRIGARVLPDRSGGA